MPREEKKVENSVVYRYILEPYRSPSSRVTCPNCHVKHSFARYVDVTNGEILPEKFGRCDRFERCGYFESPYGADLDNKTIMVPKKTVKAEYQEIQASDISLIDKSVVLESCTLQDNFSRFLIFAFGYEKAVKSLLKYKVGESGKWEGSTVFWQIDRDYDVRTGKIILYDEFGKRVKKPFPKIFWEHTADKELEVIPDYNLKQCLFGEHLVDDDIETYHLVEAEKTAIICDMNSKGNGVWLAIGGLELINPVRLQVLQNKKLIFYPDKGEKAQTKWAQKLQPLIDEGWNIRINTSLESTDLEDGSDLADFIIDKLN